MPTRQFDVNLYAEGLLTGPKTWEGIQVDSAWNKIDYDSNNRSSWGLTSQGNLQYKSSFPTYAGRYNPNDVTLKDYFFDMTIVPGGTGNFEIGTLIRFKDRYNFYYLTMNGGYKDWGGKNIKLVKVSGTTHSKVGEYVHDPFVVGQSYRFKIVTEGPKIQVFYNGSASPIIEFIDPNPYLEGAYGTWVLGQSYTQWQFITGISKFPFNVSDDLLGYQVNGDHYDAVTSKQIEVDEVFKLAGTIVEATLDPTTYSNYEFSKYVIATANTNVNVLFNQIEGTRSTNDGLAHIYAYEIPPSVAPDNPVNLTVSNVTSNGATYTWEHSTLTEDGFYIMDGNNNIIATVGENVLTYSETEMSQGTYYERKIVAFNRAGNSTSSNQLSFTTTDVAPNAPSNLSGSANDAYSITWTWLDNSTNEDQFEIVKWDDLGNPIVVATVGTNITSYTESGLTPNTEYVRGVRSKNTMGHSSISNTGIAVTKKETDTTAPGEVTDLTITPNSTQMTLNWVNPTDIDFSYIELYKNGSIAASNITGNTYTFTGLVSNTFYQFKVVTVDTTGNKSSGLIITGTTDPSADTTPPGSVTSLSETHTHDAATLTWTSPSDIDFSYVNIYEGTTRIGSGITQNTWSKTGLFPQTFYTFTVKSVDTNGNESSGNSISFTTNEPPDIIAPDDITNLVETHNSESVTLTWNDPTNTDFSHVNIYKNNLKIGSSTSGQYNDSPLNPETMYSYLLKTVDINGNESTGVSISVTTDPAVIDETAPSDVTTLEAVTTDTTVSLSWVNPTDTDFSHANLYMDGTLFTSGLKNESYSIGSLSPSTIYIIKITTVDEDGNESNGKFITIETQMTVDTTPPDEVRNITESHTDTSIHLKWDNPNNLDFDHVKVYRNQPDSFSISSEEFMGSVSGGEFIDSNLTPSTIYEYTLYTVDTNSNQSQGVTVVIQTNEAIVSEPEPEEPPVENPDPGDYPDGWSPSTAPQDKPIEFYGVGVAHDKILWHWKDTTNNERGFEILDENDTVMAVVPMNESSYTEYSLQTAMYYHRKIRAFNELGVGPSTNLVTAKTLGQNMDYMNKPVSPINLAYKVQSKTEVTLTWEYEGHPEMPAVGFRLYHTNGVTAAVVPVTYREFTLTGLVPAQTYRMFIVAYNEAGESIKSNYVTFMTPRYIESNLPPEAEEMLDPYYGVTYDKETPSTGKIRAFQSGIGDNLDLKVRRNDGKQREKFSYQMYIKANYKVDEPYYFEEPFSYRVICNAYDVDLETIVSDKTEWIYTHVNGGKENGKKSYTSGIRMDLPEKYIHRKYTVEVRDRYGNNIAPHDPFNPVDSRIRWTVPIGEGEVYYGEFVDPNNTLMVWSDQLSTRKIEKTWRGATIKGKDLVINEQETLAFRDHIQSPRLEIPWINLSTLYDLYDYQLVIQSTNQNVSVYLDHEIHDMFLDDYVQIQLKAHIVDYAQTSWHPDVHTGYYYLNQQEHFLYSDDRVSPINGETKETSILQFPYVISAKARKYYENMQFTYDHKTTEDFLEGIVGEGISLDLLPDKITLTQEATSGTFVSPILDFKNKVTRWGNFIVEHDENLVNNGAILIMEVGASDEAGVVTEWYEQEVGTPILLPTSPSRIRYRLRMEAGNFRNEFQADLYQDYSTLNQGTYDKVEIVSDSISIATPDINREAWFVSKTIDLGTRITDLGQIKTLMNIPDNASLNIYTATSDNPDHDFTNPTIEVPWIPVQLSTSLGNEYTFDVQSVPHQYMVFIVEMQRSEVDNGDGTWTYKTPSLSDIHIMPNLFEFQRVVPIVDRIRISGEAEAGYHEEPYSVPMIAELVTDGHEHPITKEICEDIVRAYLLDIGVTNLDQFVLLDYRIEVSSEYPVTLETDPTGQEVVYGYADEDIGNIKFHDVVAYFDAVTKESIVTPIPQVGSPVIIKNARNELLEQVDFRDEDGRPTLYNVEELETDEDRYLFLEHINADPTTLEVFIDINEDGEFKRIANCELVENRVLLPSYFMPGRSAKVKYKVMNSFCVHYNYNTSKDLARIVIHTPHDIRYKETCKLEIRYETEKNTAYYLADEVDINPLRTSIHSGFIYLTDEIHPAYRLKLEANPMILYRNKPDQTTVNAYVYDEFGNPVVNEVVECAAPQGIIQMKTNRTNESGMVTVLYSPPQDTLIEDVTLYFRVIAKRRNHHLEKEITFKLIDERFVEQIHIELDEIESKDSVHFTVRALDIYNQPIPNKTVLLSTTNGSLAFQYGVTNHKGEIYGYLVPNRDEMFAILKATTSELTEETMIRILKEVD